MGPMDENPRLLVFAPLEPGETPPIDVRALGAAGFAVTVVSSLTDAVRSVIEAQPGLVLAFAENGTALQTCEVLRALGDFPIVVAPRPLKSRTVQACLDSGADMALTDPVPQEELVERLRVVARRPKATQPDTIAVGDWVLDAAGQTLFWGGAPIDLTPTEFRLLAVLAQHAGRVVPARELLARVWGEQYVDDVQYVRLYIGYLRNKLENDPARPKLIITHRGAGYRLAPPAAEDAGAVAQQQRQPPRSLAGGG